MNRIRWKEVFKFLSGATFVAAIANGYLYLMNVPVPIPFYDAPLPPELLGIRALVATVLFFVFFYHGFLKK